MIHAESVRQWEAESNDLRKIIADLRAENARLLQRTVITEGMIDRALNAWFASPPSETDQGLERSMRAALEAALGDEQSQQPGDTK